MNLEVKRAPLEPSDVYIPYHHQDYTLERDLGQTFLFQSCERPSVSEPSNARL